MRYFFGTLHILFKCAGAERKAPRYRTSLLATRGRLDRYLEARKSEWSTTADDLVQCVVLLKKTESEMQKRMRCDLYFPYRSQEKRNGEIIQISPRLFSILILFQSMVLFSFSNTARRPCVPCAPSAPSSSISYLSSHPKKLLLYITQIHHSARRLHSTTEYKPGLIPILVVLVGHFQALGCVSVYIG